MNSIRFSIRLGWGTLRSRPTLTLLAVLLLGLGVSVTAVLLSAQQIITVARADLLATASIELELTKPEPDVYTEVMQRVEEWPGVKTVSYLSPEQVLREIESETGDSLEYILGTNPFPPIVRVQFAAVDTLLIDSLANIASRWPEVAAVAYPRQVWMDLDRLISRINGWLYRLALPLLLMTFVLTGLCLRAQVRNRAATWEFLALLGLSRTSLMSVLFTQRIIVGVVAGLLACFVLFVAAQGFEWLLLREVLLPVWVYALVAVSSLILAFLTSLFSRPTTV